MPTTSIFNATSAPDEIGSDTGGTASLFNGHILWCQVKAGSTIVSHFDARTFPVGYAGTIEDHGSFWTLGALASIVADITVPVIKRLAAARRSNILDYDNDGSEQPTNALAVIGEGEGNNQILEFIQNTQGLMPMWEEKLTAKDNGDRQALLDLADMQLILNAAVNNVYTLQLDPELPPGQDDTKPGYQFRLVINHQFTQEDATYWIGSRRVTLSQEGQDQLRVEVVYFRGNPAIEGTGEWLVTDGKITMPDGREFVSAGLNGSVHIGTGGFAGTDPNFGRSAGWAWDRYPAIQTTGGSYLRYNDVWPGDANIDAGHEVFPGGTIGPGEYYNQAIAQWAYLPDRVYAVTGHRSEDAIAASILNVDDHWHCRLYRVAAVLRHGSLSWSDATWMDSGDTISQYIEQVDKLEKLGLVVAIEEHDLMETNPTMPSSLVSNPLLAHTDASLTGNTAIIDMLKFYDALCTAFPGAIRNVWIGLPNEAHTTVRNTVYEDWIVTLVRRIRAKGFTGILTIPCAIWSGDLAGIARGDYDALMTRLESYNVGYNLVFEWHNYGARYATAGSTTATTGSHAEVDLDLTKCRNGVDGSLRKYPIWMSEYGAAIPDSLSATGNVTREKQGVDIIASSTYGDPLGVRHKHICSTWWGTGDSTFHWGYALCYGQTNKGNPSGAGPDPHNSGNGTTTFSGTYPWWDVTTIALRDEWLTPYGRKHWDLAHLIWQGT